ncbi:MAG TPA: GNAT family N-acetyltransferase [Candidatus Saccharicenans sp.]|jgi:ribosomal protein S18 acetylase RimI-like enzyme|nr:GNAT family N-acetyltransferase [Candidatus Saccharicenans sp.]HQO75868.1 GNAT family N-acetyltransferase [Candidatus Saccharicenans sp.]HUM79739.1 GNAT family N-acetyltransferase [Candidatus Saccharicenans sp.]
MEVLIRKFKISDYDQVINLWQLCQLPLKPEGRDSRCQLEQQIKLDQIIFLVAEKEGKVIGTVLASHDGRKGWINRLAVHPDARRQGLGTQLIKKAEEELEKQGLILLAALIEEENSASRDLFVRLGYEPHPEIVYFSKKKFPEA